MRYSTVCREKDTIRVPRLSLSVFPVATSKCSFCDTQHEDGILMSDEDIVTEVSKYPAATVILTGGEPSLWIDREFVDYLDKSFTLSKYEAVQTSFKTGSTADFKRLSFSGMVHILVMAGTFQ